MRSVALCKWPRILKDKKYKSKADLKKKLKMAANKNLCETPVLKSYKIPHLPNISLWPIDKKLCAL